jgi:hypothetical protein
LEEALELLAALEEARDALIETDHLTEVVRLETQIQLLSRRLGFDDTEEAMADTAPIRAAQAARQLGLAAKELLRLVYGRKIRYVMLKGIAHIPADAIDEYQAQAS